MRYTSAAAFRTALETRLKAHQSDAVGMTRLRKRVVFERLLARLQVVAPDAWVLKGGFALELRLDERARTTNDVDIDWTLGEDDAVELLMEAVDLDLDDRFEFALERAAPDDPAKIFAVRATHPVPRTVPVPSRDWEIPWRTLVVDLPVDADIVAGHSGAAAFLNPLLAGELSSSVWDPDARRWA